MPKLTSASVEKHKPTKYRREIPDTHGLYLVVQPSGHKSFAMRFRNGNGRQVKLTLGPLDLSGNEAPDAPVLGQPLTLVAARRLASEMNRQRALGKDTVAIRRRERLERKAGGAKTFAQAALDFSAQHLKRKARRWEASARLLGVAVDDHGELEILPRSLSDRWRDKPIAEINGDDIHAIVRETREKAVPGLKRRAGGPSRGDGTRNAFNPVADVCVAARRAARHGQPGDWRGNAEGVEAARADARRQRNKTILDCLRESRCASRPMSQITFALRRSAQRDCKTPPRRNQRQGPHGNHSSCRCRRWRGTCCKASIRRVSSSSSPSAASQSVRGRGSRRGSMLK